ncbi:MAG: FAD-binding oxidoreductase [Angustibacter sp.]
MSEVPAALDALAAVLPPGALVTDPVQMAGYARDEAALVPAGTPVAVARPTTTAEVSAVMEVASRTGTPVVPRGAGSGLIGGANAVDGCIVLSLERMDQVLEIDESERLAVVQPGVVNADLRAAAAARGLFYAPDPSSYEWSTIGGNIATNAGGLCCVKYGVTRDAVLALEMVLADGTVVRTGRRTVKGVAGYDLTGLVVGSEGTLAVVTEATLRLRVLPAPPTTAVAFFPSLASAGTAVTDVLRAGLVPSLLEIMDRTTVRAVDAMTRMDLDTDAAALLLAQFDDPARASADAARLVEICELAGATFGASADSPEDGDALLAARRAALPALQRQGPVLLDDVAVPVPRLTALIEEIEGIAAATGLTIGTFGHAGDGNLHPAIVFDDADPAQVSVARTAFDDIVAAALRLGGTVTGEHGIGLLKREHLTGELDPGAHDLHRAVKAAFDPRGILNPGKVFS